MTDEVVEVEITEDELVDEGPNPMLDLARKVMLASIGAVAVTQEELEKFVHKLIERGEIAEQDGRKLLKEMMEKRRKKAEDSREDAEEELEHRMEGVLARMNIASKSDIESLNKKLTELNKKLDELSK